MKKARRPRDNNTGGKRLVFFPGYSDALYTAAAAALATGSWTALWLGGAELPLLLTAFAGANFYASFLMIIGVDTIRGADHIQTGEGFAGAFMAFFITHGMNGSAIAAFPAVLATLLIIGGLLRILTDPRGDRILWSGLSINAAVILLLLYLFLRTGNDNVSQLECSFAGILSDRIPMTASIIIASISLISIPAARLCLTPGRIYSHGHRFARMQGVNPLPGLLVVSGLRSLFAAAMTMTVGICGFAGHYVRHIPGRPMGTPATIFTAMTLVNGTIAAGLYVPFRFLLPGIVILSYLLHRYHRARRIYLYDRM